MFLIGSRALNHFLPRSVAGKDWDLVAESEDLLVPSKEHDLSPDGLYTLEVCQTFDSGVVIETPLGSAKLPSPVGLMLLKRSHLHRPIGFEKHIRDYHELVAYCSQFEKGDNYYRLLKLRTKATKSLYGDKVPSLKKSKSEFFDDYVTKIYEHDDIHAATCYGIRPIYKELQSDDGTVWCSRAKWEALPHEDRIRCIREEAFVIALERFVIPQIALDKKHMPAKMAFNKAVFRICTTLTSGWFRNFAIENWPEITNCNYDFLGKFHESFGVCRSN
jgi:hypothetical protein